MLEAPFLGLFGMVSSANTPSFPFPPKPNGGRITSQIKAKMQLIL